jgi:D-alanyl-lipoteichoic acid acyltransferase DltB (MBOAT superfamily)
MLFHSAIFLFAFLPLTWLVFRGLASLGRRQLALGWVVLMSLVFYGYWNPAYLALIVISIAVNFTIGSRITPDGGLGEGTRRWLLYAGLAFNLGLLGYYKYANFFVDSLRGLTGVSFNLAHVILPLGISFFTFQKIAFLVDAWQGRTGRYTLVEYCFFVTFFPQLIAGPIVQHHQIIPQLERAETFRFRATDLWVGLTIFAIGLFKKMVLADGSAVFVSPVFGGVAQDGVATTDAWAGTLAYAFQLYFDFSGYSDMAIGLARMFGILLPVNFNAPYRATSIVEFWRRWHITLSLFLRNYLYIPLGGNRHGFLLRYRNLLVTMLLGGLWHGAGWTFVIWGGLHGLYLVANHAADALVFKRLPASVATSAPVRVLGWAATFFCVLVAWVFFRASDFASAGSVLHGMFSGAHQPQLLVENPWPWLLAMAVVVWIFPTTHDYLSRYTPALDPPPPRSRYAQMAWRPTFVHGVAIGVLVFLTFRKYFVLQPTEFLYFNF